MAYSLEASIIVPLSILLVATFCVKSFDTYRDLGMNAKREGQQTGERLVSEEIYKLSYTKEGYPADVATNPKKLLRFCIYLEDQAHFLFEVFGHEGD